MFVRWESQTVDTDDAGRLPGLAEDVVVRRFDAPEALDMRFHEIRTKSALNRVPGVSRVPFDWTVNPYRGCSHACMYCFARPTHEYLDLNAGRDFEREIVVKVNVPEVLRAELARPSWKGERVALGTNTDPYQWVEGRYKLMRGIWEALRDFRNPCSILTKSPLLLRDLDLLKEIAAVTEISACLSVPTLDEKAWRATEPHTPNPRARLEAVAELNRNGIPTGVLIAPLMPGINDAPEQVERIVEARPRPTRPTSAGRRSSCAARRARSSSSSCARSARTLWSATSGCTRRAPTSRRPSGARSRWAPTRRGSGGTTRPTSSVAVGAGCGVRGSSRHLRHRRNHRPGNVVLTGRRLRVTAVTDLKPGATGSVGSVVPRLSRPHVAPMARSLTHQTAQRARRAKWELAGLIPLFALTIVAYVERERIFGVDTPVRVAAAVVMVMLGWALARDLGRFTAPALFRRMDPASS